MPRGDMCDVTHSIREFIVFTRKKRSFVFVIPEADNNYWSFCHKRLIVSAILVFILVFALTTLPSRELFAVNVIFSRWDKVEQCSPRRHAMLLKTHKCASSAIQNILLRYGYQNNLTFALSSSGNYLGHPKKFQVQMIGTKLLPPSGKVDIFCLHSRLNEQEMKKVLHPDTLWITVVRDPAHLFESLFTYFGLQRHYQVALGDFGNKITVEDLRNVSRTKGMKFGKNQMLFDLGGSENMSPKEVVTLINEMDRIFDLVIITERMDESLILLRHMMCWNLEDVVVFHINARTNTQNRRLNQITNETIRSLNSADAMIYDHFLSRHQENVYKFGNERMQREVLALKALRQEYYEYCVKSEVSGQDPRLEFKEYSGLVSSYLLNDGTEEICRTLTLPELAFINLIREKQEEILKGTNS